MNKRIQELAEQAGLVKIFDEHASEYGNGMFENTAYPELEKFAKLIVKECLDQCYYRGMNDELYAGQLRAAEFIEQHFGVEE
jgi:hypothetical protein